MTAKTLSNIRIVQKSKAPNSSLKPLFDQLLAKCLKYVFGKIEAHSRPQSEQIGCECRGMGCKL